MVARNLDELLTDYRLRLRAVERRLAIGGGGGGGGDGAVFAAGTVMAWSGTVAGVPNGWVLCDGRALSRTTYPALFAAIGTTYGAGDGSTTFNVPNGKGRFVVGQDGAQVEFDVIGETGGAKTHRHDFRFGLFDRQWSAAGSFAAMEANTQANDNDRMGAYRYSTGKFQGATGGTPGQSASNLAYNSALSASNASGLLGRMVTTGDTDVPAGTTGLPPYIVQNWIISTGAGSAPSTGAVVASTLWNEFTMLPTAQPRTLSGGAILWDGAVTGTLGLIVNSGDKTRLMFPQGGTYRFIHWLGAAANPGTGTSSALYVNGVSQAKTQDYGNTGAAGVYVFTSEYVVDVPAGAYVQTAINAALGIYNWSWLRVEKVDAFQPTTVRQVFEGTSAERDFVFAPPTNATEQASLANRKIAWFNTDYGWWESYYAQTGTSGLTVPGVYANANSPAGWYPSGEGPRAVLYASGSLTMNSGTNFTSWREWGAGTDPSEQSFKNAPGNVAGGGSIFWKEPGNAAVQLYLAGRWKVTFVMQFGNGSGTAVASVRVVPAWGVTSERIQQFPVPLLSGYGQNVRYGFEDIAIGRGGYTYFRMDSGTGVVVGNANDTQVSIQYLGPPLVTVA